MSYSTIHVIQEGPANALALNKDFNQVVVAGRNVFKIFSIQDDEFMEILNLRIGKNLNLNFSCNDVAWNTVDDHYLATAATNGAVVLWNVNKTGRSKQEHVFIDHKRTVNKVSFNLNEAAWLISGSQDGTMKCFDLRVKEAVKTFLSNTESVRDVQFSPHMHQVFAAVSENGNVQLWDIRRPDRCVHQFTAHSGPVFGCDWHSEHQWLATASRDKTIKVWDFGTFRPTLEYTIHTIASIGRVKWRPQRKYHITSCALVVDFSINIWDIRRPYIPYATFNEHKDVATGVAWRGDPDVFLSTSRDCLLYQHSFNDALRPDDYANPQGISFNYKGDILYAHKAKKISSAKLPNLTSRKSSPKCDNFHIAYSYVYRFVNDLSNEYSSFHNCAQKYLLSGRSLSEICDHNSIIAQEVGKGQVSILWNIIKTLYASDHNSKDVFASTKENTFMLDTLESEHRSKDEDTPAGAYSAGDEETEVEDPDFKYINGLTKFEAFKSEFQLPKGDFCFGENELDVEFDQISNNLNNGLFRSLQCIENNQPDWTLPNEAFALRHEIQNRSPPPEEFPNNQSLEEREENHTVTVEDQPLSLTVGSLPKSIVWNPNNIVIEALRLHAELGDVQTAASVLLVLGECRICLTSLEEVVQEHWLLGYIDLLIRFQMWNVAAKVIKLSWIPSINQLSQQSTLVHTNCGQCSKPLQRSGWLCDRCHSLSNALCSICHQIVKGLYVWCQGCSHGGHVNHMKQWMKSNKFCPTGCGHMCEYQ